MIVDSHCHLDYSNLFNQLDEVIKRAEDNKVNCLLTICTTLQSFEKIKLIINKYKNIYGTFGIHPHETKNFVKIDYKFILKSVSLNKKIIGIGETGLDYYYNHSDKETQKKCFIEHITAASKLNLPLIVHSRGAEIDTYEILKSESKNINLKIVMHCFTGSKEFAKKLINLNCYISFSGIITFKNTEKLAETVSIVPHDKLLVETDSPYLAPIPFRGKPNEPAFIVYTVEKLSRILNLSKEEVMKKTTSNFMNLFNLN